MEEFNNETDMYHSEDWGLSQNLTSYGGDYNFHRNEVICVLIVVFVITTIGNTVLILVLCRRRRETSNRMDYFVTHLAIAESHLTQLTAPLDYSFVFFCIIFVPTNLPWMLVTVRKLGRVRKGLLIALISLSSDIAWRFTYIWRAGKYCCKLVRYFENVVTYASTYLLVGLTIDRLDAIIYPTRFYSQDNIGKALVISAWLSSCVISVPAFVLNDLRLMPEDNSTQCGLHLIEQWHWQIYSTSLALTKFIVPTIIIICCYVIIVLMMCRTPKVFMPSSSVKVTQANCGTRSAELVPQTNRQSRGVLQTKVKTAYIAFTFSLVFVLCCGPYYIYDLLFVYEYFKNVDQSQITMTLFIHSLSHFNPALYPIIYGVLTSSVCSKIGGALLKTFRPSSNKWYNNQELTFRTRETSSPAASRLCTTVLDTPNEMQQATPLPKVNTAKGTRFSVASATSADVTPWRNSATESDILFSISDVGERDGKV